MIVRTYFVLDLDTKDSIRAVDVDENGRESSRRPTTQELQAGARSRALEGLS